MSLRSRRMKMVVHVGWDCPGKRRENLTRRIVMIASRWRTSTRAVTMSYHAEHRTDHHVGVYRWVLLYYFVGHGMGGYNYTALV